MNNNYKEKLDKLYYFVDESWDPNFYNSKWKLIVWNEWCSNILIMWLMTTKNPNEIRKKVLNLRKEILENDYYKWVPSVEKKRNNFHFHWKDDIPEIRQKFFELIKTLDIRAYVLVARKKEAVFQKKHNSAK